MRMRIRTAHRSTFVLEDLHISVLRIRLHRTVALVALWGECCWGSHCRQWRSGRKMRRVKLRPGVDDRQNLCGGKIGKGEVVRGREGDHVAFACNWFGV